MNLSKFLQVLIGLALVVLVVFLGVKTRNTYVERDYIGKAARDRDVITVSGHSRISVKPDLALVDLGMYSEGNTVADVQSGNTQKMNAIIDAIKAMGVKDADIQTANYNLQPKIDWTGGKQNITGYTLTQSVDVKVRDLNKVGDVIQKAVGLGANQVNGVQFTVDDPTALQDQVRLKAIEDARTKAGALATALDLHLIKVVTFNESGGAIPPPFPYGMGGADMLSSAKAVAPSTQPGSLDVDMNVAVTFEVR